MLSSVRMYLRRPVKSLEYVDLYSFSTPLLSGGEVDLATRRGHPTLIVNTASKCGFTPQYKGLEELFVKYKDQGFLVIGFPSPDFAGQEFDDLQEISGFCERNFGVTFPLAESTSVRATPTPLWSALASQPGSFAPSWNFNKYLVDASGHFVVHWGSKITPDDASIAASIEEALGAAV